MTEIETTITEAFYPLPPKVATAISAVMGKVKMLDKSEKNQHGNYKFAGIDDFLEAVRPLCAAAGLIIIQDEVSVDFRDAGTNRDGKPRSWLVMKFDYTLAHSSGETWQHRPTRTIMVDASMGSQSFGAAQSYALKQFQRSLFQIATGENDDADTHPPADLPASGKDYKGAPAKPIVGSMGEIPKWHGPMKVTELKAKLKEIGRDTNSCSDMDELMAYLTQTEVVEPIEQAKIDLPGWWAGDGDSEGLNGLIERRKEALRILEKA